ncbi:ATP-dependent DNA helicase RecQ [Bacillus sp. 165]|uniref:RecQ family ATP-dependent DNA helicase n=1 Tax=Bacillus sp. 165 TaxID=1529117 RepID=UPI001AD9ADB4|nr:ATP-dependent DNA helicase RecQ [Bacillus sp. 165]MBO9128274.1 ATP-dependent DNA helicase RecQ [Bacillus sp. 165]
MKLEDVLQQKFGYNAFRTGQKAIILDLIEKKSVIAMLPTGGGKSICYQLPAYMMEGAVIVVSPLLSLMEDQVSQLRLFGEKRVVAFNSFRTIEEKREALRRLHTYKFIFVSPEMLQMPVFLHALKKITIALFVIDEAHCISQWGHDFRTDYMKLGQVIAFMKYPIVLALTATATKQVLDDIAASLSIEHAALHLYSIDRPNIAIKVESTETVEEKKEKLLQYVQHLQGPGIIYCSSRSWSESISQYLQANGIQNVAHYHGGMENETRLLIQQQFIQNQLDVISCTSAFGMGINKPNVRYVIHFHYPSNLESYLQEIGRAGRDGKDSIAILLMNRLDHDLPMSIIREELPSKEMIEHFLSLLGRQSKEKSWIHLDEAQYVACSIAGFSEQHWRFIKYHLELLGMLSEEHVNMLLLTEDLVERLYKHVVLRLNEKFEKLHKMRTWLETEGCRREALLQVFSNKKQIYLKNCCDNCGIDLNDYQRQKNCSVPKMYDWETELQLLLGVKKMEGL